MVSLPSGGPDLAGFHNGCSQCSQSIAFKCLSNLEKNPSFGLAKIKTAGRVPELDGIRGVAILLVLIWHYVGCTVEPGHRDLAFFIWKGTSLTWCGVDLFFVLSGFLIGGILLDNRDSPRFFRTFYLRRSARIFPPYYALVFGTFALVWTGFGDFPGSSPFLDGQSSLPSYLFYLQNFVMAESGSWGFRPLAITWSLAVEEQFYLLLPLAIYWTPPRFVPWLLVFGIFECWATRIVAFHLHPNPVLATYTLLPFRCDALLAGALLSWVARYKHLFLQPLKDAAIRAGVIAMLLAGYLALIALGTGTGSHQAAYWGYSWLALIGACLIAICLVDTDSFIARLFRARLLRYFGTISYGLYLVHEIVHHTAFWIMTGSSHPKLSTLFELAITAFALCVSVLIASFSWHYFERPFLRRIQSVSEY